MCHVGELEHAEKIEYCTTKPDKTRSLYIWHHNIILRTLKTD